MQGVKAQRELLGLVQLLTESAAVKARGIGDRKVIGAVELAVDRDRSDQHLGLVVDARLELGAVSDFDPVEAGHGAVAVQAPAIRRQGEVQIGARLDRATRAADPWLGHQLDVFHRPH